MGYSIYFKYKGKKYKLPVNPEEIKRSREMHVETYQVLNARQVSVPSYCSLEEFTFEAEFPSRSYHYLESGARADADYYEKMFRSAQKELTPVQFIASNDITDDISMRVLVTSVEAVEKAGEEGDKYLTLKLLEYKAVCGCPDSGGCGQKRRAGCSSCPKSCGDGKQDPHRAERGYALGDRQEILR